MSEPISIRKTIDDYMAIYATRVCIGTLVLQRYYMGHFLDWITARLIFDLRAVTREHIEQYKLHVQTVECRWRAGMKQLSAKSRRERLNSVHRFFAWAVSSRILLVDPAVSVKREKHGRWQPENVLTEAEIVMLLEAPDLETPKGIRDRAVLELLYSTGLRRAEIAALELTDIDLTDSVVFVRKGKGAKQRLVPIGESAIDALTQYLKFARPLFLINPRVTGLFLVSSHCGQRGRRLGHNSIMNIVHDSARKAGITKRVTPHTLRHSFATHLLRAGADLRHVQELLGHSRIDATECYTHLNVSDLAAAHTKAHPRGTTRRMLPWELPPPEVPPWEPSDVLSATEVAVLRDAAPCETPLSIRNRAILELLHSSGLRRSEIVALDLTDVDLTSRTVRFMRRTKERVAQISDSATEALMLYLNVARPALHTQVASTALFINCNRGLAKSGSRLHPKMVNRIVRAQGSKAGITRNVTPSMFKRSLENAAALRRSCPQSN
jgi:integrase/recombinase XerD